MKKSENQKSTSQQSRERSPKPFFGAEPEQTFFAAERAKSTPFFQPQASLLPALQAKSIAHEAAFKSEVNANESNILQRQASEPEEQEEEAVQRQVEEPEKEPVQRQVEEEDRPLQTKADEYQPASDNSSGVQHSNKTGLPDRLKAGIENLSGIAMDDVKVHYNSSQPAQLQALAYTQGTEIHVSPGQERHLPHEAWHVVQQKQGRVQPTLQTKDVAINDDAGLEKEADVMGNRSHAFGSVNLQPKEKVPQSKFDTLQRMGNPEGEELMQGKFANVTPTQFQKSKLLLTQNTSVGNHNNAPVQRASNYNGAAITSATGAWGPQNLQVTDEFDYNAATGQNTAAMAHAKRIDGSWIGVGVSDQPDDWEKFTQLVGPYSVKKLVQGHLLNERIGGKGDAENLTPLTTSANTIHWNSVEAPIKTWLDADQKNLIDYKVTPRYTGAKATLKTKLIDEFKSTHTTGTSDTAPRLRTWVGNYIDATIPAHIDINVYFMQANGSWPYNAHRARRKPLINARINNREFATFTGANITGNSGAYSGFNYPINDRIQYGAANGQNVGIWGHADRIDQFHAGSKVGSKPTNWTKFTQLVGPDAVNYLVQGHLINQKIGGQGINQNLTPLTTSANSLHASAVESPIKSWLKKNPAKNMGPYLVDYKVTPSYTGAHPALKTKLLKAYDATNTEIRGSNRPTLINWLGNYIDATFPERLDVSVRFMKSDQNSSTRNLHARAKTKPALNGNVTNEPA